jgi:hypothetical protein
MVLRQALLAATLLAAAQAQAAGVVEVKFVEPERYTDAGLGGYEIDSTTRALGAHFKWLAGHLPDGQTVKVDVLDIDLAGNVRHGRTGDIRVLRGGVDIPRFTLRYQWLQGERVLAAGEDKISELNYMDMPRRGESRNNLPYEERLLTRWFDGRFVAAAQAQ